MARALKIRLRELQRQARAGTLEMQFQQGLVILADVVLAFAPEGTALLQVLRWAHWSRSSYYRRDQTEAIPPPPQLQERRALILRFNVLCGTGLTIYFQAFHHVCIVQIASMFVENVVMKLIHRYPTLWSGGRT